MTRVGKYDREDEEYELTTEEILVQLKLLYDDPTLIVISGGEPMMQQASLGS